MAKKVGELLGEQGYKTKSSRSSSYFAKDAFDFFTLIESWSEIVGPKMGKHTIPIKNVNKTLTILTNHPAYSSQLTFLEEEIKKKIFTLFPSLRGSIKKLYFQTGTSFFEQKKEEISKAMSARGNHSLKTDQNYRPKLHPQSPQFKALKSKAMQEFNDIEDEELKQKLISIYIQISQ